MAVILFCWELGGGLGHVVPHLPLADDLARQGHRVAFALKQTDKTGPLLHQRGLSFLQAPIPTTAPASYIKYPCTYAHILHNSGYHDAFTLLGLVRSWRALFQSVQPDLIVCDHAPTALLASRPINIRRVMIGSGFTVPPENYPLPNLRPWRSIDTERLRRDEDRVCETINGVLAALNTPPVQNISELFRTEATFLRTLKELDPYDRGPSIEYWGPSPLPAGVPAEWPKGTGPRVFAYLKPSSFLEPVLKDLTIRRFPTLVVCPGLAKHLQQQYASDTMSFSEQPVDMQGVLKQCDFAVLNATLNSVIDLLLAGKPMLLLPLALEQFLTAKKVEQAGAGVDVSRVPPDALHDSIEKILAPGAYAAAAQTFAARYAAFDRRAIHERLVQRFAGFLT